MLLSAGDGEGAWLGLENEGVGAFFWEVREGHGAVEGLL
jgi:hypothetical protein